MNTVFLRFAVLLIVAFPVMASESGAQTNPPPVEILDDKAIAEIRDWLSNPVVEMSVTAHNR
ncbi:MAG: hypothetical protein ABJ201_10745, partial [Nisaea sp.]